MTGIILREAILPRMDGIRKNVEKLRRLAKLSEEAFLEELHLDEFEQFLGFIADLMKNPGKLGLGTN